MKKKNRTLITQQVYFSAEQTASERVGHLFIVALSWRPDATFGGPAQSLLTSRQLPLLPNEAAHSVIDGLEFALLTSLHRAASPPAHPSVSGRRHASPFHKSTQPLTLQPTHLPAPPLAVVLLSHLQTSQPEPAYCLALHGLFPLTGFFTFPA